MLEESSPKLITCFLPKGNGLPLIKLLSENKGIQSGNVDSGRGTGAGGSVRLGTWIEIDILTVVVGVDRAEEIFNFIYEQANIGEIDNGFMFQGMLTRSTVFQLPVIPREKK